MRVQIHRFKVGQASCLSRLSKQAGSALVIVMMLAGIIAAALGTYLCLLSNENQTVMRSLTWNGAMATAEAGIEEALSHLNQSLYDYSTDGWTPSGTNYFKQRSVGDSYYSVNIAGSPGSLVTITSTGSSPWMDGAFISRDVQVVVRTIQSYSYAGLVAKIISLGGNFQADSFDSADPAFSTNGNYDPAKASDKAVVATPGLGFTLSGSSRIYGSVATSPGGSVSAKGAALVGDKSYSTKGTIQPGHITANFTNAMPDVTPPFSSATTPTSGMVGGTSYTYALTGGKYMTDNLDAGGTSTTMSVSGDCVLYVTGNVNLSQIVFQPGAKLELFLGGSSITFAPTLVGATPPNFSIFGLPTCTSMVLVGGTAFAGTIYAPECDLKAMGNASLAGAIVAKSFTCSGTFDFHYDLAAGRGVTILPVTILSWNELF
jgi:hypothetical protein